MAISIYLFAKASVTRSLWFRFCPRRNPHIFDRWQCIHADSGISTFSAPSVLQAASRNAWGMQKLATAEVISLKVKGPFVGIILRLLTFIVL